MPALTPSIHPPSPAVASPFSFSKVTSFCADSHKPRAPELDAVALRVSVSLKRERVLRMSFMRLEVPAIQENMAASLVILLLGHVLFLNSQVPLCVVLSPFSSYSAAQFAFLVAYPAPLHNQGASPQMRHPYPAQQKSTRNDCCIRRIVLSSPHDMLGSVHCTRAE